MVQIDEESWVKLTLVFINITFGALFSVFGEESVQIKVANDYPNIDRKKKKQVDWHWEYWRGRPDLDKQIF